MMTPNKEIRIVTNDSIKMDIMKKMEGAFRDTSKYTKEFYIKICKKAVFIAAFCEEKPCGYLAMYANDYTQYYAYVTSIAVSPNYQQSGIGQAMIDKAIETAIQLGMKKIRLEVENSNETAIHFYSKNFFRFERKASVNTSYMIREKLT